MKVSLALVIGIILGITTASLYARYTLPAQCIQVGVDGLGKAKNLWEDFKK